MSGFACCGARQPKKQPERRAAASMGPPKIEYAFEDWRAAADLSAADEQQPLAAPIPTVERPKRPAPVVILTTGPQLEALWGAMAPQQQLAKWSLAYGLRQHGASLATAYRRLARLEPTLLLVAAAIAMGCRVI